MKFQDYKLKLGLMKKTQILKKSNRNNCLTTTDNSNMFEPQQSGNINTNGFDSDLNHFKQGNKEQQQFLQARISEKSKKIKKDKSKFNNNNNNNKIQITKKELREQPCQEQQEYNVNNQSSIDSNQQQIQDISNQNQINGVQLKQNNRLQQLNQQHQNQQNQSVNQKKKRKPRCDNNAFKKASNYPRSIIIKNKRKDLIDILQNQPIQQFTFKKSRKDEDNEQTNKQTVNKRGNRLYFVVCIYIMQLIFGIGQKLSAQFQKCEEQWNQCIQKIQQQIKKQKKKSQNTTVMEQKQKCLMKIKKGETQIQQYRKAIRALGYFKIGNQYNFILEWFGVNQRDQRESTFKQKMYLQFCICNYLLYKSKYQKTNLHTYDSLKPLSLEDVKKLLNTKQSPICEQNVSVQKQHQEQLSQYSKQMREENEDEQFRYWDPDSVWNLNPNSQESYI